MKPSVMQSSWSWMKNKNGSRKWPTSASRSPGCGKPIVAEFKLMKMAPEKRGKEMLDEAHPRKETETKIHQRSSVAGCRRRSLEPASLRSRPNPTIGHRLQKLKRHLRRISEGPVSH